MRISELSRRSGAPVTTLKYYLREGLVHEGERRSGNQTDYDESHVQRVRLVRALLDTGGLSIAAARRVLATLDADDRSMADTFEAAQHAMTDGRAHHEASDAARRRVAALAGAQGWRTTPDNPGFDLAARVLDDLAAIGYEPSDAYLDAYAAAADRIARADLAALTDRESPALAAELMVVGTVVGDALIAGLRRLAHQEATAELFPTTGDAHAAPATHATQRKDLP
ncbi:MerR family transcriptional regulator [Agromyces binzhouensis]|uniref:MerR family transcriptional regulator n=1 Tax=Agromyces binzhouensis TaxID=1817495 RepID=A0A4Q2JFG7_9MICO|nr:MerR family transcriptional regulator [Agromyces binzhouensis]RXZ45209.1 MerR family transcriptional regulator [Agromyces binzhouensis]